MPNTGKIKNILKNNHVVASKMTQEFIHRGKCKIVISTVT